VSPTTLAWLVLAFPLVGTAAIGLGWRRLAGRSAGWIATGSIALSFAGSIGVLISLLGRPPAERQVVSTLYDYANTVGVDARLTILVDPVSVFMILVVSGISMLIHL
jgi:NADH-quinone oxidoreductase subunit L